MCEIEGVRLGFERGERGKGGKGREKRTRGKKKKSILIPLNIYHFPPILLLNFKHLGRIRAPLLLDFWRRGFFVIFEFFVDGGVGGFALAAFGPVGGSGDLGFGGFAGCCFGRGGGGGGVGGAVDGFEVALDGLEFLAVERGALVDGDGGWRWGVEMVDGV